MISFSIITCAREFDKYLIECVESVKRQSCTRWKHTIIVDNCNLERLDFGGKTAASSNVVPVGAAANIWSLLMHAQRAPNTVIVMLDGDDRLADGALDILSEVYRDKSVWATYGSYDCDSGDPARYCGVYGPKDNLRTAHWNGSHLKTFRTSIARYIRNKWLCDRYGRWLTAGSDMAIMIPILEMCGPKHRAHINRVLCHYNDVNPNNDHKVNAKAQKEAEDYIRRTKAERPLGVL